jgi:hypothetical protein
MCGELKGQTVITEKLNYNKKVLWDWLLVSRNGYFSQVNFWAVHPSQNLFMV